MSRKFLVLVAAAALVTATAGALQAAPPLHNSAPQQWEVYDNTNDGLDTSVDPDIGNVRAVANPGGQERVILEVHIQKAAPNCEFDVDLVRGTEASNGGLDESGHSGSIVTLGTLTTNGGGNGNAHFDFAPSGDGIADTQMYAHIDLEERSGTCLESDGTTVQNDEYGAAPDPALDTPFTYFQ